ncbi:gamma-glutamylcyclotransferase family protein [Enterococcus sp. LJL98]
MQKTAILPLFTYGSLMENFFNYERYLTGKTKGQARKARIQGSLYHLTEKGYPALLPAEDWVYGEVFELLDFEKEIGALDKMEGYDQGQPNEYHRETLTVFLFNEQTQAYDEAISAYVYRYAVENDFDFLTHSLYIPNGDWRHFMEMSAK